MIAYQFIILRYQPDHTKQEFINLGVALYAPGQFLGAKFNAETDRLRALFNGVSKKRLRLAIGHLNTVFNDCEVVPKDQPLQAIADGAIPLDHDELQWSRVRVGASATSEFNAELVDIYQQQVTHRLTSPLEARRDDAAIWKHFREPLRRRGIDHRLVPKPIETLAGGHTFHHARRVAETHGEGEWHLYQPISLDSPDPAKILDRAYHWLGRGIALSDASEHHRFYFLVGTADQPDARCERAIQQAVTLLQKIDPERVTIVRESESESFAESLAEELVLTA